jgi:primosomal protein N' (replication factor Y) (superfamily II helicase)
MPDHHASAARKLRDPADCAGSGGAGGAPASTPAVARVSVLLPLPLDRAYDYLVPPELALAAGDLVHVPLGSRVVLGVVWDSGGDSDTVPVERLKPVAAPCEAPPLPWVQRRFIEWVADYNMVPWGVVLRMALSSRRALEPPKPIAAYRLAAAGTEPPGVRLTPARRRVLSVLSDGPARPAGELARAAGVGPSVVKRLTELGAIEAVELPRPPAFETPDWRRSGVALSPAQAEAAAALGESVRRASTIEHAGLEDDTDVGFSVTLLDGVTGAGKTEVYLEAVAAALEAGRQVLVLLPEIALTAQWLDRFRQRFAVAPAEWHSDLSQRQRRTAWRAVAEGEAKVVVGARSALFLPYRDLGLMVVDEEHDLAFKQEDGVTYNARDMAIVRARLGRIPIVLVSATPSLETVTNVKTGRFGRLHLPERHGAAVVPRVELVDLRADPPPRLPGLGPAWLSGALRQALGETFEAGEQALLFLNRRGYAPLTLCRTCGHRLACPNCTAWLVAHRLAGRLQCHHCGHADRLPRACPECGTEGSLAACGPGVERLLEEVTALFPDQRTRIVSSDTLTGPAAAAEFVRAMGDREIDLLIGTQVVAKGHHFPWLTLVGVVDGDLGLAGGDLRAAERTFQLLHQVAGRAGRAERPGRALVQTYDPEHPVMQALATGERDRFLETEAENRRAAGMPPFSRLAALILACRDEGLLDRVCGALARTAPRGAGLEVLGPAPAPLAVLRRQHRRRFLVRAARSRPVQRILAGWLGEVDLPAAVRLRIDIDPYSFL